MEKFILSILNIHIILVTFSISIPSGERTVLERVKNFFTTLLTQEK